MIYGYARVSTQDQNLYISIKGYLGKVLCV
ncbi:DNA invertase Pin-like site-specific DNA recombinase [Cytobacillus purgationiresistens]|uniref:DNA invertase Pin-like site-specific DNA recombinase n=1 Tax=Cytobacillus purgationiresistens TaxID=863449 RepID=A0ABU0ALN1_9BACI|nr:DNA invertase Pin-like site-specific DNA recombinase [Cytobacillus purgationiresistens]